MVSMEPRLAAALVPADSPWTTAALVVLILISTVLLINFFAVAVRRDLAERPAGVRRRPIEPTEEHLSVLHEDPWPLTGQLTEIGRDQ